MTAPSSAHSAPQKPLPPAQVPRSRKFKSTRVIIALLMREVASTDSRSSLGFLWQFIEPVAAIALMTVFFQFMMRLPPLGTNFPLFYITGVLPFQAFQSVSAKVSIAIKYSRPLLEFPSVRVVDALAARFLLTFIIQCSVFVMLTMGVIWFYELRVVIDMPLAAFAMLLAGGLGLAVGTFNSVLVVAFPVYSTVYGVLTRPLIFLSGVLFLPETMPEPLNSMILWNPVSHPVAMMRGAFYSGADMSYVSPLFVLLVALAFAATGLVMLQSFFRDALER